MFRWESYGSSSNCKLYIDDIKIEVWDSNVIQSDNIAGSQYTINSLYNGEYYFRVWAIDNDFGPGWPSDAVLAQINLGISPEVHPSGHTSLGQISPNPVSGMACIPVTISKVDAGSADLAIYDLSGRKIVDISNQINTPGAHTACWNCTDSNGYQVPGGLYFCVLDASRHMRVSRRLIVVW